MKRLLLWPFRATWRVTTPAREALDARVNAWFYQRIVARIREAAPEATPGAEAVVRELARLQLRVDELEAILEARPAERTKAG